MSYIMSYISYLEVFNEATGDNSEIFIKVETSYDVLRVTIQNALTDKFFKGLVKVKEMQHLADDLGIPSDRFKEECLALMTGEHKDAAAFLYSLGENNFRVKKKDSAVVYLDVQLYPARETYHMAQFLVDACQKNNALDKRIEEYEEKTRNPCTDPKQSSDYKELLAGYKRERRYRAERKAAFIKTATLELNKRKQTIRKLKRKLKKALQAKKEEKEDAFEGATEKIEVQQE